MDSVGPGRTKVCTSYMDEVRGSLLKPPQLCRLSLRATQGARAARSQDQKSGNGLGGGGGLERERGGRDSFSLLSRLLSGSIYDLLSQPWRHLQA